MPKFYFKRENNTFLDYADYPEKPADRPDGEWVEGFPELEPYQEFTSLEMITIAVKQLPVEKRTSPEFGVFLNQCLLAIQNQDNESLHYLLTTFNIDDPDYQSLIAHAKTVFGIS